MMVDWSLQNRTSSRRSDGVAGVRVRRAILGGVDRIPTVWLIQPLCVTWKPGVCGRWVPRVRLIPGIRVGWMSVIRDRWVLRLWFCRLMRVWPMPRVRVHRTLGWTLGVVCGGVGVGAVVWGVGDDWRRLHSCNLISLKIMCMIQYELKQEAFHVLKKRRKEK